MRRIPPIDDYKIDDFHAELRVFGIKDTDYEIQGLNALYLLMKGKFLTELRGILEDANMPATIKLLVSNYMVRGRYFEMHDIVAKTLVDTFRDNLDEWKKSQDTAAAK